MSGLPSRPEDAVNGIDVREQGNALRVATNTPHLVSLGTGRLSTAVTLHPIKQGRVTIGSDPTCDIYVAGTGVCSLHCRVENSHAVVTLYPINGSTLLDGLPVDRATRLSQGSMLTIGRSNYLRFNHPEEAKLMKSVLPDAHLSMAPIQFTPNEECAVQPPPAFAPLRNEPQVSEAQYYQQTDAFKQKIFKDATLNALDRELDMTLKEMNRRKPPVAPRKPYRDLDQISDSNSDQDSLKSFGNVSTPPKPFSIMAKVSKFEYYAKSQQKTIGRSQFYTNEQNVDYSPKVFSSNSLTVNTPARDVLGGKNVPTNYKNVDKKPQKMVLLNDSSNCSYANVMIKNKISKIDDIAKNFDDRSYDGVNLKKVNNVDSEKQTYNVNEQTYRVTDQSYKVNEQPYKENDSYRGNQSHKPHESYKPNDSYKENDQAYNVNDATYGKIMEVKKEVKYNQPSASFDRNPQFPSAHSSSTHTDRSTMAENMRLQAYRDRVEEQQQQEAESARLEEILNMCAEYERQITTGTPSTPTEKRSQNKIITNGSLPRSIGLNNPNFIQTSDGYFKFDTSPNRLQNSPMSKSLPLQRNLSNYENVDMHQILPAYIDSPKTPQILIRNPSNYENVGRMDEIGIPIAEDVTSPIMIRKLRSPQDFDRNNSTELPRIPNISTPLSSPYENVFYGKTASNFKPKSPNTQSPRTRIKTTFAHKNISPPQYFVFPTPPPIEDNSKMLPQSIKDRQDLVNQNVIRQTTDVQINGALNSSFNTCYNSNQYYNNNKCSGIEKQLSLDEEIPMIDDSDLTNDLESRSSQISPDSKSEKLESPKSVEKIPDFSPLKNVPDFNHQNNLPDFNSPKYLPEFSPLNNVPDVNSLDNMPDLRRKEVKEMRKFEDMRKELIADIPELEEFERDLANNKREKILNKITNEMKNLTCVRASEESLSEDVDNYDDLRTRYDSLKESRRKVLSEIHELKSRMSEIRTQEDDILRELEMEKALIKGEYDSEIAILNIEQKNKKELIEKAKKVEEDIRAAKQKQEARQNELRERVEIATLQVERLEAALSGESTTSEELQNARDILDNETKLFEDLEFQHLEVESEMLAYREDLQNDIIALTKKIESQKSRILTLKSEANNNLTSALEETKVLQADYVQLLNKVEGLTTTVQAYEKELKEMAPKLNLERAQSPLSSNSVENTQAETTDLDRSASSSDSDEINFEAHQKNLNDKFSSIDQMSQSMIVDLGEKRNINDLIDSVTMNKDVSENLDEISEESKTESQLTPTKEKKGFWERNFDSLTRLKRDKKKSPSPKSDIMSQSLNENMFFNNENIESDYGEFQKFNSLKLTKNKNKNKQNGVQVPVKSSSSSKIPTFSAFGKIIKKDSFGKKNKENGANSSDKENSQKNESESKNKNRFVKNSKSFNSENKYSKARQYTPDIEEDVNESGIETENERSSYADSLEGVIEDIPLENLSKIPKETPKDTELKSKINDHNRMLLRKSCGDEPGVLTISNDFSVALSETGKVPSQDDIDRISKVRINAPLVSSDADKNSLGRKTLDSLMEIERNRLTMLEEQGCQVIENEREKISELKRRVQNETKKLWESERVTKNVSSMTRTDDQNPNSSPSSVNKNDSSPTNFDSSLNNDLSVVSDSAVNDSVLTDDTTGTREVSHTREHSLNDGFDAVSAGTFPDNESSGVMSDSIEELQSRPVASVRRREDRSGRPHSDTSDVSNENTRSSLRVAPYFARTDLQRPLTRYLPIDREDLDLRHHIESAGHQVELCPHVIIDRTSCRGYLHKLGAKFHAWSKRWFVFDRDSKTFIYYSDKSEKKPRGGAYFQVIEEVYLDHGNSSKSPNPQTTFVVKTRQRRYYLMSPSGEAARIWIDVMFTGAQGYLEYLQ